jgi:hypothetical protein
MTAPLRRNGIAFAAAVFATVAAIRLSADPAPSGPLVSDGPLVNDGPGLSLRIADEAAPAGSIVQIKVEVTEPKPISTGRGKIKTKGITTVNGIVLMNKGQDTYGVAMVNGDELSFAITSPSSLFGTEADYPILGLAGTVDPRASNGATFPLTLDPSGLGFRDPSGAVYAQEIKNGHLTVSNVVTIGDVSPGSSVVPAGGVVRISGTNFTPSTRLQLNESDIREQRFISSQRIDVVLGERTNMHGLRIRARNDDGDDRSESEYYSYERTTTTAPSSDPILSRTVPLFAPATYTTATVDLPVTAKPGRRRRRSVSHTRGDAAPQAAASQATGSLTTGPGTPAAAFALQNLNSSNASVSIELLDPAGNPYAVNTVAVGPSRYLVREIGEVFGVIAAPAAFRIRSNVPLQVLGLVTDPSAGSAAALPPR